MRCFVASFVPRMAWPALRSACPDIAGPRWLDPETYHVTFEFLGEIDDQEVASQIERVAGFESFFPIDCRVVGIGGFPRPRKATVVAARLDSDGALEAVAEACGADRFKAHVTLGRCRRPMAVPLVEGVDMDFQLTTIGLYRSQTLPSGARYSLVREPPGQ